MVRFKTHLDENPIYALTQKQFEALPNYSCSFPTAFVDGKTWRRAKVYSDQDDSDPTKWWILVDMIVDGKTVARWHQVRFITERHAYLLRCPMCQEFKVTLDQLQIEVDTLMENLKGNGYEAHDDPLTIATEMTDLVKEAEGSDPRLLVPFIVNWQERDHAEA